MHSFKDLYLSVFERLESKKSKEEYFKSISKEFPEQNNEILRKPFGESLQEIKEDDLSSINSINVFSNTKVSLKSIHNEKVKRSRTAFIFCLIFAGIAVGVTLYLFLIAMFSGITAFEDENNILNLLSTTIPAVFSGTFFFIYKSESDNLEIVEKDIRMIEKVEGMLSIINDIDEKKVKKQAFLKVIEQIKI